MQKFYMLTAVDVRRSEVAGSTRATIIDKLTMPALQFPGAGFNAGGSVMDVNWVVPRLQAPEPKFSVKGIDTDIFDGFGQRTRWTMAGAYRDKGPGGGKPVPARVIIEGAVSGWQPDDSSPTEFQGCDHTFTEVTHIEFSLDGEELYYVDRFERVLRFKGVDLFADERAALGA